MNVYETLYIDYWAFFHYIKVHLYCVSVVELWA